MEYDAPVRHLRLGCGLLRGEPARIILFCLKCRIGKAGETRANTVTASVAMSTLFMTVSFVAEWGST
jgi:hypothetical protein